MTVRKLYLGSIGPFLYNDADQRPDGTGLQGLVCEGAPIGSNDVLRLADIGTPGLVPPADASYVVMGFDGVLSHERRLQVGNSLSLTDSGANADVTLDTIQDIQTSASPTFAGADFTGAVTGISLSEIENLTGHKTFTMANKILTFRYTAPSPAGEFGGAFEIDIAGGFTGDGLHVHQHSGNPGAGVHLVHFEAEDPDVLPLCVTHASRDQMQLSHTSGSIYCSFQVDSSHNLAIIPSSTGGVGIGVVPSYKFSIGSADGSDQVGIYHDNSNANFRTTDGVFNFQTDEGVDTNTYLTVRGKGTGSGFIYVYDGANYGRFHQTGTATYFLASSGAFYLSAASELYLQFGASALIRMFHSSGEGTTRELEIVGYRTGDQWRSLQIGVGVDAADTASFDGVSNYYFDGNVGIKTAEPGAPLDVKQSGDTDILHLTGADGYEYHRFGTFGSDSTKRAYYRLLNYNEVVTVQLNADGDSYFLGGNVGIRTPDPNQTLCLINEGTMGDREYSSGWVLAGGTDWALTYVDHLSTFELDDLWVRGTLRVYELIINQIHAVNGGMVISAATGKVETIIDNTIDAEIVDMEDPEGNNYTTFAVNDIIMIQRVDLDAAPGTIVKRLIRRVTASSGRRVTFTRDGDLPGSQGSIMAKGDTVVTIGNTSDTTRDSLIYLTAQDINNPFISLLDGVDSWAAWTDSDKVRAIFGNMKGKYNYTDEIYGLGVGVESDIHMTMDPTNGLRIIDGDNGDEILLQANAATLTVGSNFVYTTVDTTLKVAGWTINPTNITHSWDSSTRQITMNVSTADSGHYGFSYSNNSPAADEVRWLGMGMLWDGNWTSDVGIGMVVFAGGANKKYFWLSDAEKSIAGWQITEDTLEKLSSNVGVKLDAANALIQIGNLDEQHLDLLGADGSVKWYKSDGAGGFTLVVEIDDNLFGSDPGIKVIGLNAIFHAYEDDDNLSFLRSHNLFIRQDSYNVVTLSGSGGGSLHLRTNTASSKVADFSYDQLLVEDLPTSGSAGTVVHWYSGGEFKRYTSSRRYKTDIGPLEINPGLIHDLEVKSYTSKSDGVHTFGLIAEEVYEVIPDIVNSDEKGRPDSIREPLLAYMMLEELKKLRNDVDQLIAIRELN